jgi:hypothetical protein
MARRGARLTSLALGLSLLAHAAPSAAVLIYVDGASNSCSTNGPGSASQPFCTISAALTAHHGPGDTILVRPATYREQVTVPGSGASGNPLVLLAAGASVVVDGADAFSSATKWTVFAGNVYRAADVTWNALQVFMDGARLTPSTAAPASLPAKSFRWISGQGLYVNAGGGNPGLHQLLVGRRSYGFNMFSKSWVTIDGFDVTHTESRAVHMQTGCSDIVVRRNRVTFANSYGIQTIGGLRIVIEQNVVSDCNFHGIGLTAGADGCTVRDNESFRNADPAVRRANGIHLDGAPNNGLYGNRLHDNQDSGVQFSSGSDGCISYNNRSWKNGDHGFDHFSSAGTFHTNDDAYGNYMDGFSIEGNSPNSSLYNCISVDNGQATARFDLWVNDSSSVGFTSDCNIIWNSSPQQPVKFISTIYPTLATYQNATQQDLLSIQANPRFVNGASGDFRLLAGSPAIDAANSGVANWPATDAVGHARVDDPSTPNAGRGALRYGDRGALEFVTNQAPVVSAPPSAAVAAGDTLTLVVTASDPEGDPINSLVATGLPSGASFTPAAGNGSGTFRWVPTMGDASVRIVKFIATNAFSGVDSTTITVLGAATGVPLGPSRLTLTPRVVPNPVRARGELRFALATDGAARVELFDLSGRAVRRLMDEAHAPAGEYTLSLDVGAGIEGSLPAGLYFYRIQAAGRVAQGRFLILR